MERFSLRAVTGAGSGAAAAAVGAVAQRREKGVSGAAGAAGREGEKVRLETAIQEEVVRRGGGEGLGGGGVRREGPELEVGVRLSAPEGEGVATGRGGCVGVLFVVHGMVGCGEEIRVYICVSLGERV